MKSETMKSRIADALSEGKVDDLIQAIKDDHKDLKKFIKVMKDGDATSAQKKSAAQNFMSLLKSHSSSEEKALYQPCLKVAKFRVMTDEGFVEHEVAARLMKKIAGTKSHDRWLAEVKVLAELVEHHVDEEEKDFLPKVKKYFSTQKQESMANRFFALRQASQRNVSSKNAGVLGRV